jgi:hypothetical protein
LDFKVDAGFYYLGRWPNSLVDAIGEKKEEIYKSLRPNPLEPDMLVASRTFRIKDRDYEVTFGVEVERASQNIFRVINVRRVPSFRKR